MSFCKVMLYGRLTKKPVLSYMPNSTAVVEFAVAVNERWTDKNGDKKESVEFVNVKAYSKLAENVDKFLDVGREVFVEGKLVTRSWEKEGVKHYKTEIISHDVQFIGSAKEDKNLQERQKELVVGVEQIKEIMKPKSAPTFRIDINPAYESTEIPF